MRRQAAVGIALALLGTAACTDSTDGSTGGVAFRPTFAAVECPGDVSVAIVGDVSCGYLSVLEDRDDRDGRTVRVFVSRVMPAGEVPADPYMIVGGDLADATNYGGFAPAAERTGRELIMIDARGVGHSEPSLACPEVDELSIEVLEAPADDPATRADFLDAVADCYERVTSTGVDPSKYSLDAVAADVADLRKALGIQTWTIASHGSASRIAFEVARRDPAGVRGLFLDSPSVPEIDPFTEGIEGTTAALEALAGACADDRACSKETADLGAEIDEALEQLDASPVTVRVSANAATDGPADVVMDDIRFLAMLRQVVSDGGSSGGGYVPGAVPAIVREALGGAFSAEPGGTVANLLDDQPYCTGFLPKCTPLHRYSYGALLSYVCRDVAPFVDVEALAAAAPNDAAVGLFVDGPFLAACERWPVAPAEAPPAPTPTDVGALVLLGGLDPYANPAVVGETIATMTAATIVQVPAETHNLSVIQCAFELRRTWLDDPNAAVDTGSCGADLSVSFTE